MYVTSLLLQYIKKFPQNPIFFLKRRYSLYTYSMIVTVHGYFSGLRQIIYLMLYFSFFLSTFPVPQTPFGNTISLSKHHQSVSEWVSLFGCSLTPLKRQTPVTLWDGEGFRLKNIRIRRTVSRKIVCILAPHSTLAVNFIFLQCNTLLLRCVACWVIGWGEGIGEVGRGWGD